ncbi:MAG: topoisomerase DNA-binding C4 zinc finger domain-containing protein, partial [Thermoplasmata archaeon]|nr:topoisomerase DNA-binding C4 zinc finger domain-containing protein [Thermoplasmata archaeon]
INPECTEHQRAFRIGTCPSCGSPLNIRYSFRGNRFVGCSGYPTCKVTYPLPQRGKLEKDHPPCPVCRAPVVTAIEAGRPPWKLCINPECPTRAKSKEAKARKAKLKGRPATKTARSRPAAAAVPPTETPETAASVAEVAQPKRPRKSPRVPTTPIAPVEALPVTPPVATPSPKKRARAPLKRPARPKAAASSASADAAEESPVPPAAE